MNWLKIVASQSGIKQKIKLDYRTFMRGTKNWIYVYRMIEN